LDYLDLLKLSHTKFKSNICFGIDPVIKNIPLTGDPRTIIVAYYEDILNEIIQKKIYPSAIKQNYGCYAQYGIAGIEALIDVTSLYKHEGFPIILDIKEGDIDIAAAAYARQTFDIFHADAVTVSPYMGFNSIQSIIDHYPNKGCYILTKTSNKSSIDIQDMIVDNEPLYLYVAKKIIEWYHPGIGALIGATYPEQLSQISVLFIQSGKEIPLLMPGIGIQGGKIELVMNALKPFGNISIHRINSSSGICYAYKKYHKLHYAEAAVKALKELNDKVASFLYP